METVKEKKRWTYNDYLLLDDNVRYEIIQGDLLMIPAPNLAHQRISRELGFALCQYLKDKELGEIFYAPIDVVFDSENILQPDIVVVLRDNEEILKEKAIVGAPDVVIEIISPTSITRDRNEKHKLYEKFGVPEYWLVDPGNKSIEVYTLEGNEFQLFSFAAETGSIKSKVINGFEIEILEIMTQ